MRQPERSPGNGLRPASLPPAAGGGLSRAVLYSLMALHVGGASATYIFGKAAALGFDNPEVLTLLRAMGAAVIFLLLTGTVVPKPRFSLREWGHLCWLGFLVVPLNQYCFIKGLQYTVPSHPALLYALTPMGVLLLDSLLKKSRPPLAKIVGVVLALGGVLLILRPWEGGPEIRRIRTGDFWILGAVLSWVCYTVAARESCRKHDPIVVTAWSLVIGALMLLPIAGRDLFDVARGNHTGGRLVFAGLAGGGHQRHHDAALECPAARFNIGGGGGVYQCAAAHHRPPDGPAGGRGLAGSPAGSRAIVLLRHAAGDFGGYNRPVPARLTEAVSKKSFGPISALGSGFKSSAYCVYACGLKPDPALILNQNPIFDTASGEAIQCIPIVAFFSENQATIADVAIRAGALRFQKVSRSSLRPNIPMCRRPYFNVAARNSLNRCQDFWSASSR